MQGQPAFEVPWEYKKKVSPTYSLSFCVLRWCWCQAKTSDTMFLFVSLAMAKAEAVSRAGARRGSSSG